MLALVKHVHDLHTHRALLAAAPCRGACAVMQRMPAHHAPRSARARMGGGDAAHALGDAAQARVAEVYARIAELFGRLSAFQWRGMCVNPAPMMRALTGPVDAMAGATHAPQDAAAAVREMRLSDTQVCAGPVAASQPPTAQRRADAARHPNTVAPRLWHAASCADCAIHSPVPIMHFHPRHHTSTSACAPHSGAHCGGAAGV